MQPQLPGAGQQVAVAAQKRLPLVDALLDEVGVHLEVEHHRVPLQAEQALFQLFFQLGVVALVLIVAGDAGRKQSLGGLGWGLQHKASSFISRKSGTPYCMVRNVQKMPVLRLGQRKRRLREFGDGG